MAQLVKTLPVSSKDTKATAILQAGDSWKSIGEFAACIMRGTAK